MGPGVVARRIEERQGHQGDCGSNGQGADEAHEEANEAREAHQHLDTGGNHDCSLQLKRKSGAHRLRACGGAGPQACPGHWDPRYLQRQGMGQGWIPKEPTEGKL